MDIALATDRRCVTQTGGHSRNGRHHLLFYLFLVADLPLAQTLQGLDGGEPRPEVLRREGAAARFTQVVVDVRRVDPMSLAFRVDPLKQFLPGYIRAAPNDPGQRRIADTDTVSDAAFAAKLEGQF